MRSTMMDVPLLVSSVLRHASRYHGDAEIVSRTAEGPIHRTTYADVSRRSERLARALAERGLERGDRVGTLAWNGYRHLEIYYGAAGAGHVCHTINPRLFPDQIAFIIEHAADRILFVETDLLPLLDGIADRLSAVEAIVVLTDPEHMPAPPSRLPQMLCYETLLDAQPDGFTWPPLDETEAAALCYTSGTTGDPKGVLYSHRSIVLHAMAVCMPDVFAIGAGSVVMSVVPMFHVNAWGLPHAAPMAGAKLVLPGPKLDGESLYELMAAEAVTFTAGVPTVWMALLDWMAAKGAGFGTLRQVAVGGSACPRILFQRFRDGGVEVVHAWGMTETSPVGLANRPKRRQVGWSPGAEMALSDKQGRPLFGMEFRIVDEEGRDVARDGSASGAMQVRGPWVASGYFAHEGSAAPSGWFETGDVATMDVDGYVQIVDRTKDVIKSGGEWISSIALENVAASHPAVAEAAVVARADPRWAERPLLVVVARPGTALTEADMLDWFAGKVPRWWVPDRVVFAEDLPHTATGKLLKTRIRESYAVPTL